MPMIELTIQLRAHFSGEEAEEKNKVLIEVGKTAAKHWLTTALLLSDKRKPQVVLQGSDFFCASEEISLADDIQQDVTPEGNDGIEASTTDGPTGEAVE